MIDLSAEFPQDPAMTYLNHAALGPWPKRCSQAIEAFARQNTQRGAADYAIWYRTEASLRERLRWLINAPSTDDIALLKNTTEGLCAVAWGLDWQPGDNVVIGAQEFPSNRLPWMALARLGVETRQVDLYQGEDPEADLIAAMDERTRLLSISAVQFDSGLAMDLKRLGLACRQREILYCVDAIQSLGALPFDVQEIGAHFVAADGHKWLLAPEAIALFYVAAEVREKLALFQQGWRMVDDYFVFERDSWIPSTSARRFEAGSCNTLGMIGLDQSLSLFQEIGMQEVESRLRRNVETLIVGLGEIQGVTIRTPAENSRRAGIVNFSIHGHSDESIHRKLVNQDIVCAVRSGVRLAPGFYQTTDLMQRTVEAVSTIARGPE